MTFTMRILRFIFPFVFARNWYTGQWEVSPARLTLFLLTLALVAIGIVLVYVLQRPIVYTAIIV